MNNRFFLAVCTTLLFLVMSLLPASAQNTSAVKAEISNIRVQHNVTRDSQNGLLITADITVVGLKDHMVEFDVWVYDNVQGQYQNNRGGVSGYCASDKATVKFVRDKVLYDSSTWKDYQFFLPFSVIAHKAGLNEYAYRIQVRDSSNDFKSLAWSSYHKFNITYPDSAPPADNPARATISNVRPEFNYKIDDSPRMQLFFSADVYGMKGKEIVFFLWIYDNENGHRTPHYGKPATFYSSKSFGGQSGCWERTKCSYDHSHWDSFRLVFPYKIMNFKEGINHCSFKIVVGSYDTASTLGESDFFDFSPVFANNDYVSCSSGIAHPTTGQNNVAGSASSPKISNASTKIVKEVIFKETYWRDKYKMVYLDNGQYRLYRGTECESCQGTGICRLCHGSGIRVLYTRSISCQKECMYCNGIGLITNSFNRLSKGWTCVGERGTPWTKQEINMIAGDDTRLYNEIARKNAGSGSTEKYDDASAEYREQEKAAKIWYDFLTNGSYGIHYEGTDGRQHGVEQSCGVVNSTVARQRLAEAQLKMKRIRAANPRITKSYYEDVVVDR